MKRLTLATAAILLAAAPSVLAQEDAAADPGNERVNQVIVYGDDPCPPSTDDEITVCARKEEGERYRIPEILRQSDDPANVAWSERVKSYETVGTFGTMSCTPSGLGGWTGCTQQLIDAAYAEREGSSDVRFSELIQQEREKRLSTIDEEAAEEQARVEALEREYEARLAAERAAEVPGETPSADSKPASEAEEGD